MKRIFLFAVLLSLCGLFAEVPRGTLIFEAESFNCADGAWVVKPHFPSWYADRPSAGKFLSGHSKKPGSASKTVSIAAPGKYKLHFRYLDVLNYPAPFQLTVRQAGTVLTQQIFNEKSQRSTPDMQKKYGGSFARFMWYSIEFDAPSAGELELQLTKLPGGKLTPQGTRHLDLFLLTSDLNYQPKILDISPLYVQIKMLNTQVRPVAIHVFGKLSRAPHYPPHMNINKTGLVFGAVKGFSKKHLLGPGDASPWMKISTHLTFNGEDRLLFDARRSYKEYEKTADFEVIFSRTPDDKNIVKRFKRSGKGNGILVSINLTKGTVSSDLEESNKTIAFAWATTPVKDGKTPELYPFLTGMRLNPNVVDPQIVANESEVIKQLGVNGVTGHFMYADNAAADFPYYNIASFFFHLKTKGCFSQPDLKAIGSLMKAQADTVARLKRPPLFINLMDEPDFPIDHIGKCAVCKGRFAAYLAEKKAGVSGEWTLDKSKGALYYWSVRFRNHLMTEFFRTATNEFKKFDPSIKTSANFAPDVTGGSSIGRGCDWFEILNSGALTYGWHEDWANLSGTYQSVGFQNAVMRAACRKSGVPYGIYNILCRHPWEVQAKGFSAIGYGNSAMHFFNYGPHYAISTDTNSRRPEIYQAIKNVTFAAGAVEKTLTSARPVRGDAAMLLSQTGDIWNLKTGSIYGKERVFLHLLLRHCNYRTDVLSEDDLADQLKSYKVLFVVDSHIRRSQLKYILDWVKQGNTLYLGANALTYDEFNKALDLPFARREYKTLHPVGRGQDGFVRFSRKNRKFQGMTIIGGEQLPHNSVVKLGRGRVICSGFFPGLSYMHDSKAGTPKIYSVRNYPAAHRRYIASLKLPAPLISSSDNRIEAHLLESSDKYLIVLSNWTGKTAPVTVKFNGGTYTRTIGAGGFIKINK